MKKSMILGILPFFVMLFAGSQAGLALETIPAITFNINGTFAMSDLNRIGAAVAFNVPYALKAATSVQIQGAPPGTTFGVEFNATANGCPEGLLKVNGHCYPTEPMPGAFTISAKLLQENGQAWTARPIVLSGPGGECAISGRIVVTFTRIIEMPPVRTIKVTAPAAGSVHAHGQAIAIAWNSMGAVGASVRIRLVPQVEPQAAQVIAASTANDGAFSWTPTTGFPGQVWIEVQSLDGKVTGKSGLFAIQ
jgi:Developmentally Regulated MAPK Interacting Protein.